MNVAKASGCCSLAQRELKSSYDRRSFSFRLRSVYLYVKLFHSKIVIFETARQTSTKMWLLGKLSQERSHVKECC